MLNALFGFIPSVDPVVAKASARVALPTLKATVFSTNWENMENGRRQPAATVNSSVDRGGGKNSVDEACENNDHANNTSAGGSTSKNVAAIITDTVPSSVDSSAIPGTLSTTVDVSTREDVAAISDSFPGNADSSTSGNISRSEEDVTECTMLASKTRNPLSLCEQLLARHVPFMSTVLASMTHVQCQDMSQHVRGAIAAATEAIMANQN
jgi:hypothetical protein